jgi:myo-inositol-1(or 4)-monophosphatase
MSELRSSDPTAEGSADPSGDAPADPGELLALATDLARRAAALLVDGLDRVRSSIDTKSSGTDLVTEMDRASEALIVAGILAARPDDGIVGEEGTDRAGTSGVRWIIDPLDGTTNYVYGHPGFGVSIAVQVLGAGRRDGPAGAPAAAPVTVAGCVVDPVHDACFTARRGGGAARNGEPITCSEQTDLAHALVGTGFAYQAERRRRQAEVLTTVLPAVRDIRRMGAAAVDLCSVACGRLDAYFESGLAVWDLAAGALIAAEAGALVGDLHGGSPSPELTIAAAPAIFAPLRDLLETAG